MNLRPFHLAIPVHCLDKAKEFYEGVLDLKQGRIHDGKWIDYSLNGHQSLHRAITNVY